MNGTSQHTPNPLLRAALSYIALGWPVFPCHTPDAKGACSCGESACGSSGKHPRTVHGVKDASIQPNAIQAWWMQYPDANPAHAMGDGRLALDWDRRNGGDETLAELERKHGALPMSRRVITGNGGHIFFNIPKGLRLRGLLGDGIDAISSTDKYVMAPPSLHFTGRRYEVDAGSEEIADCPQWVLDILQQDVGAEGKPPIEGSTAADTWLGEAFKKAGWLGHHNGKGKWTARCPWLLDHSPAPDGTRTGDGKDSSTVLMPPTSPALVGGFSCRHGHCYSRTFADVRAALPREAIKAADEKYPRTRPQTNSSEREGTQAPPPPPAVWTPASVLDQWTAEGPLVHQATGLEQLDKLTGGGPVYGSRWYFVGSPDAGKTALLVQLADDYARAGVVAGLHMVDEEATDAVMRLAQRAGFTREQCEARDQRVMRDIHERLRELPIRLYGPEHTIETAAADLDAFAKERRARAMLGIDSIQSVECNAARLGKDLSTRELVSANVRAFRDVATRYRLLAMATCEMNRASYKLIQSTDDNASDLASAKESGAIEYSARVLVSLRSVRDESDLIDMRLAKNKHGPSWRTEEHSIFLRIDRTHMKLRPAAAPDRPDADQAKEDSGKKKITADAAHVVDILIDCQGTATRNLYPKLRSKHGSFSDRRADAALARLGSALVRVEGARRAVHLHVAGALLPPEVLALLPPDRRAKAAGLTPPSEAK